MSDSDQGSRTGRLGVLRRLGWFGVGLGILGFGVGVFLLLKALKPEPQQRDLTADVPVVESRPLQFRRSPLLIAGNGMVRPRAEVGISSQVSGEVIALHPALVSGGSLRRGDVMIQVDPRSFEANVRQAEADVASARANQRYLEKQIIRIKSLKDDGYAPEESLDDVYNRRDQAKAGLDRAEAVLEARRLELEHTAIKAPFDGRVLSESVDVGDIVAPGAELARFFASDEVEIIVSLTAKEASFIPGLWRHDVQADTNSNTEANAARPRRAWVTVNHGGQNYQWPGYLHRVESDIDRVTRTVDVVVRVPQPFQPGHALGDSSASGQASWQSKEAPPLLVGMYSEVQIEGMELEDHFVIPIQSLRQGDNIWIAEPEGILSIEPVEFVRQEGNFAVVRALPHNRDKLVPGTPIITGDIALATDGMRISTINGESNNESDKDTDGSGSSLPLSSRASGSVAESLQ